MNLQTPPSGAFPKGFFWGAATSSHQVEGENYASDWAEWEKSGRVKTPSGAACDHYRRFREDFDLAKSLGHNAHRFSIEWSRVEPEEGVFNEGALVHYREVAEELCRRGIEPFVTLHHFTLPQWLVRDGGFTSEHFVKYFLRFAERVSERLSDVVRYWVTFNEPMVLIYMGYIEGKWPPGERSFEKACLVFKNLVRAHKETYRLLHAVRRNAWVGIAKHLRAFEPYVPFLPTDCFSVWLRCRFFNHFLIRATTIGFPKIAGLIPTWLADLEQTSDYIGVNYYTRDFVGFTPSLLLMFGKEHKKPLFGDVEERTSMGWEVYPEGLYRLLVGLKKYKKPIFILENGLATEEDPRRIVFIRKHLQSVARAIRSGADVRGYFHWSLMDNFEWADGFEPRFGLVGIDYKTLARKSKPSAEYFARICRSGKIE